MHSRNGESIFLKLKRGHFNYTSVIMTIDLTKHM